MTDETEKRSFDGVQSLMAVANDPMLQADEQPITRRVPDEGELSEAEKFARAEDDDTLSVEVAADGTVTLVEAIASHKAIYNPATGRLFDVTTDDYEVINPNEFIGPLCKELKERDHGDIVGSVYVSDGGSRVYSELLFEDTHNIWLPGRGQSDPVRTGFNIQWSHEGSLSVRVRGFAQDTACTNSIREVTSPIHVKHAGDVDGRIDWREEWATALDELGAFSESLAEIIEEAMDHRLFDLRPTGDDEGTIPQRWVETTDPLDTIAEVSSPGPLTENDVRRLYSAFELLGFPAYLGVVAVERLTHRLAGTDDPRIVPAWDMYSAATYALTHNYRGSTPNAGDYHRDANDILLNPGSVYDMMNREAYQRSEPDDDDQAIFAAGTDRAEEIGEDGVADALRVESERRREMAGVFGESDE